MGHVRSEWKTLLCHIIPSNKSSNWWHSHTPLCQKCHCYLVCYDCPLRRPMKDSRLTEIVSLFPKQLLSWTLIAWMLMLPDTGASANLRHYLILPCSVSPFLTQQGRLYGNETMCFGLPAGTEDRDLRTRTHMSKQHKKNPQTKTTWSSIPFCRCASIWVFTSPICEVVAEVPISYCAPPLLEQSLELPYVLIFHLKKKKRLC